MITITCVPLRRSLLLAVFFGLLFGVWVLHDFRQQLQTDAVLRAARKAHNAIVGYVCHELRNPLHVLEAWFSQLLEHVKPSSELSVDVDAVRSDVAAALLVMRGTVDDVLDSRKVCSYAALHDSCRSLR